MKIPRQVDPRAGVLILGSGALGVMFAARLAAAGVPVTVLDGWREGMDALQAGGAELDGRSFPVRVARRAAECSGMRHALVLVKGWQTETAARDAVACLGDDGIALTLQNGLGNEEVLAGALGEARVARGITSLGATLLAPGRAVSGGDGPVFLPNDSRLGGLREMLQQAGFQVRRTGNMPRLIWSKLAVNAAINPLSALLRLPNGDLLTMPAVLHLMDALAGETAAVALAQGIALEEKEAQRLARQVARRTAANRSSMLQDVLRGARTEVDWINGAVVRHAASWGVPVPVNQAIWGLVSALS